MRATPKQYALSLFESLKDADESQVKNVVREFAKILIKNNEVAKVERIVRHFIDFWNKGKGIIEAEIISARELEEEIIKLLRYYVVKLAKNKNIKISRKIDKDILGGVIVKYDDKILDLSLKTKLEELRQVLKR